MFTEMNVLFLAFLSGFSAWFLNACGAAGVFIVKNESQKFLDMMLGFAGGIMIAASFWSLLEPAIELSASSSMPVWFPPAIGFVAGGVVLRVIDRVLPHLHIGAPESEAEGLQSSWHKSILLILAIALHNIPEGLALGVAVGAAVSGLGGVSMAGAAALTIGIGVHNIPEGFAVSAAVRGMGLSKFKSFWYGQLSAAAVPVASLIGAAAVVSMEFILPYALSFAAGAMIFVVIEEVIPEAQRNKNTDIATEGAMAGFLFMMILELFI